MVVSQTRTMLLSVVSRLTGAAGAVGVRLQRFNLNINLRHNFFSTSSTQYKDFILDTISDAAKATSPAGYVQPMPSPQDEIVIAMSSGVDSSLCAAMFAERYPQNKVRGVYMANWDQPGVEGKLKCTEREWNEVQRVCDMINIPCERVSFEKEYWIDVFMPMIEQYKRGLTPNPDVSCNRYIKFGKMIEHLEKKFSPSVQIKDNTGNNSNGKWWLVTGHYSRIMTYQPTGQLHLLRGSYPYKDQSYYLSSVPPHIFPKLLLPLGHITKPQVRALAKQLDLPTAEKPDSQGLCFVSQTGNFRDFLNQYIDPNPGNIITKNGSVFGQHQGLWHATIGQRAGISMPQGDERYKGIWFVSEKRYDLNELVIVKGTDNEDLFSQVIDVEDWHWAGLEEEKKPPSANELKHTYGKLTVQHRSLQEEIEVDELLLDNDGKLVHVSLKNKSRSIAPGQNLVLYGNTQRILGCGMISRSGR